MAKNKNNFGKLLAFTTTIAAIGGACYIFRDKIKQSSIYKLSADKFNDIYDKFSNKVCTPEEDDFFFDDDFEEPFSEDSKNEREYTSITINPKEESSNEEPDKVSASSKDSFEDEAPDDFTSTEDSIPTISFHSVTEPVTPSTEDTNEESASASDTAEVTGYENEGLSDVSEDSDVLEEQDRLDF